MAEQTSAGTVTNFPDTVLLRSAMEEPPGGEHDAATARWRSHSSTSKGAKRWTSLGLLGSSSSTSTWIFFLASMAHRISRWQYADASTCLGGGRSTWDGQVDGSHATRRKAPHWHHSRAISCDVS